MFGLADRATFSIEYLIANIATGLLLLGNRLAYAQSQLTLEVPNWTKVSSSNTTNTTTCKKLTDNAKRITFLISQLVNSRAKP